MIPPRAGRGSSVKTEQSGPGVTDAAAAARNRVGLRGLCGLRGLLGAGVA